jgi:DEAD/DEAH box helicase domain-containing protein
MMNFVYFDLETQKSADDVGGWSHKKKMGFSFGVTYSSRDALFRPYEEEDIPALVRELSSADCVVGFNIINFDYEVLTAYSNFDFSKIRTIDLLADLHKKIGFRVGLNNFARATLNAAKSADGLQALTWFKEGNFAKIAIYCRQDVIVTRDLHRFGCENKYVYYFNSSNQKIKVPISW